MRTLNYSIEFCFGFMVCAMVTLTPSTKGFTQELQRTAYSFINVAPAARINALGGVNVSLTDRDVGTLMTNPSTVGDSLSGFASLNYQFYVADIGQTSFVFLPKFRTIGTLGFAVNHFSYGSIDAYDPVGNPAGSFRASETAIVVSKSHQIRNFRFGASLKGMFSSLAGFNSSALAVDLGGVFIHPKKNLTIAMVLKNVGFVVSDYTESSDSSLPIDLQVGATVKPEHMPLHFSITAYRLIGSEGVEYVKNVPGEPTTMGRIFRHLNFGGEVLLHRNVNVLVGYNYGVHHELKLENGGGAAGISFGFSARIKSVEFVFSRSTFAAASAGYTFTLSKNVQSMWMKK